MTKQENYDLTKLQLEILRLQWDLVELKCRATGRTTRLVDEIIQRLFNYPDEWVSVVDHFNERRANVRLLEIIKDRLWAEHHAELMIKHCNGFDSIKLKNYHKLEQDERFKYLELEIKRLKELYEQYTQTQTQTESPQETSGNQDVPNGENG